MVTPAPMACAQSAIRNTCRDNKEGGEQAPQERRVRRWKGFNCWVGGKLDAGTKNIQRCVGKNDLKVMLECVVSANIALET